MIKSHSLFHFYLLVLGILMLSSCNSKIPSPTNEVSNQTQKLVEPKKQIGEYILATYEDKKGNLWFGTQSLGVAKFDGKKLKYYTTQDGLCGNAVISITEDKNGNLWMATQSGVSKFNGKKFVNYSEQEGINGEVSSLLVTQLGELWVGTHRGVFRMENNQFIEFPLPNPVVDSVTYKWEAGKVVSIFEDRSGNIWFGRDGYGTCKFDGISFEHFTEKDGLCGNTISSISQDMNGNLWFGSVKAKHSFHLSNGGIAQYDGKKFKQFSSVKGLFNNNIHSINTDKTGNLWICASGIGMYCYNGKEFSLLNAPQKEDSTSDFGVLSMLEDSNGKFWFGCTGGLYLLNNNQFVHVGKDNLISALLTQK